MRQVLLVLALAVVLARCEFDGEADTSLIKSVMQGTVEWIESQGSLGPVYYVIFLSIWVVLLLPCSILEMVPGYLFGFQVGTVSAILGKTIGTGISLFIGRFFLKGWIQERLLKKYPTLLAFEKAVKLGGFKTVLAIRITYLPMLVKNYGLACLDIPLSMISSASFVSAIPFAMLWNIIGASAKDLTEIFEGKIGWRDVIPDEFLHYAPFGLVIAAAIVYVFYTFVQDLRSTLKQIASSNE